MATQRWTREQALEAAARLGQVKKVREALEGPTLTQALINLGIETTPPPPQKVAANNASKEDTLGGALERLGLKATGTGNTRKIKKNQDTVDKDGKSVKKKRQGVDTGPIFRSIKHSKARSKWGNDWLALDFPGARLLSYNELYSILQFRKYVAFSYKKICQKAVTYALMNTETEKTTVKPYFNGPTRLTLVRRGTQEMDREALTVIFKYMTDALKREGIIEDDNPNIIVDIQTLQDKGEPRLAMKLQKLENWVAEKVPEWDTW